MVRCCPLTTAFVALLVGASCDRFSCATTTDPLPIPARLEEAYATEDGTFEVVLRATDATTWPPRAGVLEFAVDIEALDAAIVPTYVEADPAHEPELDLVTEMPPLVEPVSGQRWRVRTELPEPGSWILPLRIRSEDGEDDLELVFTVGGG